MAFFCNPLDLPYRYQRIRKDDGSWNVYREGADPSIVRFRGRYYAFVSMTRGFFHSTDLADWNYQRSDDLPAFDYAPDARIIDGAVVVTASRIDGVCPFYRSEDPLGEGFVEASAGSFAFYDPSMFQDDDGATYLYWGCSPFEPIYGSQVDPVTFSPIGERRGLIGGAPQEHGWEKPEGLEIDESASDEEQAIARLLDGVPLIEGAWMTKHDDVYHLQYAAPRTESSGYADGVYTAPTPLGPFKYSPHSPYSSKPGGFITGAGHGSTFRDEFGNWWHASTMRISVNHRFERRVGMFPAGFDEDGVLFCIQNFADFPMSLPTAARDPRENLFPEWMLLSYRSQASASSSLPAHRPELAVDEDVRTWWVAATPDPGQWLQLDLGTPHSVSMVQINLADHHLGDLIVDRISGADTTEGYRAIDPNAYPVTLTIEVSLDGKGWSRLAPDSAKDTAHQLVVAERATEARYVRVTATSPLPFGAPLAISGLRVFGRGYGPTPAPATGTAQRTGRTSIQLQWPKSEGAIGYNVRYGIQPTKLYHSWLVYDQTDLDLHTLNAGEDCWFAIDAFNENGVTEGRPVNADRPEHPAQTLSPAARSTGVQ